VLAINRHILREIFQIRRMGRRKVSKPVQPDLYEELQVGLDGRSCYGIW
jgi:hypothetical protein